LIWLDLALAAIVGAVVGWFAHALIRGRKDPGWKIGRAPVPERKHAIESREQARSEITPPPASSTVEPRVSSEADTAGRVIAHISSLGRLGNDEVGLPGFTQQGMSKALGIRQGTLAKALSRLQAAKVIEVDRRHV